MIANRTARRTLANLFVLAPVALAGCVDAPGPATSVAPDQPRHLSYDCGDGGKLAIESFGGSVVVTDPEGEAIELPASPPAQRSRYGKDAYALVVGDGEALWMKAGKRPITCHG